MTKTNKLTQKDLKGIRGRASFISNLRDPYAAQDYIMVLLDHIEATKKKRKR